MSVKSVILAAAAAIAMTAPAMAQTKVPVGHLADYSGATSDVGVPFGQGVADALAYINKTGGVGGSQMGVETFDYGYQVPRAISQYKKWSGRDKVVAIQGWGTADTEALITFIAKDEIPYFSGSYAGQLTDPNGSGEKSTKAAPFNFFYGPSYSDSLRAMLQWAAEDWKAKGGSGKPKYVHMGANHPYPNAPKEAGEELAKELGFDVLPAVQFALTPGDYTAQCLTLKDSGANYAYLGNTAGSNISVLRACDTVGAKVQFMGNVWGMDENAMKAAGQSRRRRGLPGPHRCGLGRRCARHADRQGSLQDLGRFRQRLPPGPLHLRHLLRLLHEGSDGMGGQERRHFRRQDQAGHVPEEGLGAGRSGRCLRSLDLDARRPSRHHDRCDLPRQGFRRHRSLRR